MSKWLSKPAVLWVFDEAPDVPSTLVSTLLAVARYAGSDGRGAHPSATTVAAHTRKSESQAKRDLAALEKAGLICRGDQRIVAYIRADRRPTVYDLPIPRGSTDDTPWSGNGVAHRPQRGSTQGPNGVAPVLPEEFLKNSGRRARDRAGAQSSPAEPKTRLAPPCSECGKPFSQELLADPEFRAMAMASEVIHNECMEANNLKYLRTASIQRLIEDGAVGEAIEAGARQPDDFPADIAAAYGYAR